MKVIEVKILLLLFVSLLRSVHTQTDTVSFQWPAPPFNSSHNLNATFAEFRNTLSANHFHSGVDIGLADGSPVYPCIDGVVNSFDANDGSNSWVRVRTNINGRWKHITYIHIQPNPALTVGSTVLKGQTILGSVIAGMGHVHLTERELVSSASASGVEINSIRDGGGLKPYTDSYTPVISKSSLLFRRQNSTQIIPFSGLSGKLDIIIRIDERNGPGSAGSTQTNNGTYKIGYRILSPDSAIIYNPPDDGLKFQFDKKPSDAQVGNVFWEEKATLSDPYYIITNGYGSNSVNSSLSVPLNYFDTGLLPEGNYLLYIFTEDTRGNKDKAYFPISITRKDIAPPSTPTLNSVTAGIDNRGINVTYTKNTEPDLKGYRLYYSRNLQNWFLASDETQLTKSVSSISFNSPSEFLIPTNNEVYYYKLTAVDTVETPNESEASDIYVNYNADNSAGSILIVDGFDRYGGSGSWGKPTHSFAANYLQALPDSFTISSCSNESVISGVVELSSYDIVIWFLGDESTVDNTLTSAEQTKLKHYLEGGGNLFISGSEIGWDLGRNHSATEASDLSFYNNYLKAVYLNDGSSTQNSVKGVESTSFSSVAATIGQVYPEDYPDDIEAANSGVNILQYNAKRTNGDYMKAGISYSGKFGTSDKSGKLVYISFPFETISSLSQRKMLASEILKFFDYTTGIHFEDNELPTEWSLSRNYPNPFNSQTNFEIQVPDRNFMNLSIYDVLGRKVAEVYSGEIEAGIHKLSWTSHEFASGIYFAKLSVESKDKIRNQIQVKKLLYLK